MEELIEQIKKSLDNNLYYLTLFAVLALPDICGAIDSYDGEAKPEKYCQWFDKYVTPKYNNEYLDGKVMYRYRCSALHQGSTSNPKNKYDSLMFFEPAISKSVLLRFEGRHVLISNGAMMLDLKIFCLAVIEGVNEWLIEKRDNKSFQENMKKFIHVYPYGTGGIIGAPIIS